MSSERAKFEYENENELIEDYKKNINNQTNLNLAVEYLYETLVEETIMSVAFQCHFESKHPVSFAVIFIHEKYFSDFLRFLCVVGYSGSFQYGKSNALGREEILVVDAE